MPFEAKDSGSGFTDFEYGISFLIKRHFPVVHDKNSSCTKVLHYLGLLKILHNSHPVVTDTHLHQSKYSLKMSSKLCCEELLYSMQGHAYLLKNCVARDTKWLQSQVATVDHLVKTY